MISARKQEGRVDHPLRLVPVCLLLIGCAAEQARGVPLYDLSCNEDDDCGVVTEDLANKCAPVKRPYAISKSAGKDLLDCPLDILWDCAHERRDWEAVCSDHICKIRSARWILPPRRRCKE